jgi:phospholipid N-methyltransferase
MIETLTYIKTFLRDKNVASITPTSSVGVKRVCSRIDFKNSDLIIEYGPGTGVFTNYLLANMRPDARLLLIELNRNFSSILRKTIQDPRVLIENDSAENVLEALRKCQESRADYILSGIPFFWLRNGLREKILTNTFNALKTGGKFLVYQTCFQTDQHLKIHLDRLFPLVTCRFELMNVPPMRIYEAIK